MELSTFHNKNVKELFEMACSSQFSSYTCRRMFKRAIIHVSYFFLLNLVIMGRDVGHFYGFTFTKFVYFVHRWENIFVFI